MEFRTLFELCRLADHETENPVSIPSLASACDLTLDEVNAAARSLKNQRLLAFDTLLDYLCITHFGVSEVVSAKAQPNTRTHYFPSLKAMGIRLRRGHHLFDSVEPVWPDRSTVYTTGQVAEGELACSDGMSDSFRGLELNLTPLIAELQTLERTLKPEAASITTLAKNQPQDNQDIHERIAVLESLVANSLNSGILDQLPGNTREAAFYKQRPGRLQLIRELIKLKPLLS